MKVDMLMNRNIEKNIKFKVVLILVCIGIFFIIFARNVNHRITSGNNITDDSKVETDNGDITRAEATKMLSLLEYSKEEVTQLTRTIPYVDSDSNEWYDKYMNASYTLGLFEGEEEVESTKFHPKDKLTYGACGVVFHNIIQKKQVDISKDLSFSFEEKDAKKAVSEKDWLEIYDLLINKIYSIEGTEDATQVEKKELFVFGIPSNVSTLTEWQAITDSGTYDFEGINTKDYLDKKVNVYIKGNEIIYIQNVVDSEVTLHNVWIISNKGEDISVFINGVGRTFQAVSNLSEDVKQVVGDLVIVDKKVVKLNIKPEKINGKVLVATDQYIEIEGYGKVDLEDNYRIYRIYGELMMELTNDIVVGYNTTDFVVSGGKICAALIKESVDAKDIRVLIRTNEYQDIYHKKVQVTSDTDFTITYGKKQKSYKAGKTVTIKPTSKIIKSGRVRIVTSGEAGKITVLSLDRESGSPSYRGSIEVAAYDEGLTVINELPLEEYLYAVLPSEMPVSYGIEALKVQAVCARSYAYNQLMSNSYSQYGAHVDDSTNYQVYNNYKEDDISIQAVKDTYGKVIEYKGEVIFAYYFSTSSGHTADVKKVWLSSQSVPYLKGKYQGVNWDSSNPVDFSDEAKFREFLSNAETETYDKSYPWYRWNISLSFGELEKTLDDTLKNCYTRNANYIKTMDKNGKYKSISINTVGNIKSIKVSKREASGLASEIIITGTESTIKVDSETNIRQVLTPLGGTLIRKDNSKVNNVKLLPSSFMVLDDITTDNEVTGIKITGGGFGHGVGMSQNGAKTMTSLGKTYEEVLKHYYDGIDIGSIY